MYISRISVPYYKNIYVSVYIYTATAEHGLFISTDIDLFFSYRITTVVN